MNKKHLFILCLLWATCIAANAEEIPNDEIWYTASEKLTETTYDPLASTSGLHTNAFNTTISSHIFSDGKGIIKFEGDVTSIGGSAFYGCKGLISVTIPNPVKSIGSEAFHYCSGLTSITIPNSATSIGERAFYRCQSLSSVTIPNSVTNIGARAFYGCKFIQSEFINNSSLDVVSNNYWGANIYDVIQEDGLCINDSVAESYRGRPTSITIPNSVTSIGSDAFAYCSSLSSVTIPNSVVSIRGGAFHSCSGLASITIPSSVTSIGSYAFYKCSSMTSITIPKSVTSIGYYAFAYCSGLQSVKVSWNRPLSIDDTFTGVDYSTCILYVPKGTATLYMVAPEWIKFTNIQEYSDSEEEYVISIKQGDAGCVKDVVEVGKTAQYIITPAEGWSVNSVSFNGRDVTNSLIEGRYTTPVITGNSELNVVFKQEGSGVKDLINSNVKVLASNGSVIVSGNGNNGPVVVYSVGGAEVASDLGNCNIHLNAGIYIVKVGTEIFKVAL